MIQESERNVSRFAWVLGGASLGALVMFLADPDRGRRRRALATDKMRSAVTKTGDVFDVARRDFGNRMQGLQAQATRVLRRGGDTADDRQLAERVRQAIGRTVSHPHAIQIDAHDGCITLGGPVLAGERQALIEAVRGVTGVSQVEDWLDVHETAEGIDSLQGSGKARTSTAQDSWSPSARALALVGGGVLGIVALTRRSPASAALATAGIALMARSISNMPFARMAGFAGDRGAVNINKTIHIEAQPERVFEFWSNYENFPRFMSHVQEVRDLGNGRSHWVVKGPVGAPVEWDATITESRRGEVLAWRSEPDSTVQNSGRIRFEPDGNGTRVSVHMTYSPPAGVLGHAVASLFAADPKQQMDEDLMRMKAFIEGGKTPRDAAQPAQQAPTTLH